MRRIVCSILLCFFVLCLNADEFVVHHIHSNNILLKALAETIIEVNIKDRVSISIVDDIAYITYNSSKKSVEFRGVSADEGTFFFKKRKSHIVKLFMEESSVTQEIYFILEKNGKRKMRVTLKRV